MTIVNRKQTRTVQHSAHRAQRPVASAPRKPGSTVRLVRPQGTPDAIERGRRLAEEVRKELAELDNESLDETMRQLRGRSWSL